jgi:TATA-box binding protein (TBP) (component of TFIID and TFIIIB)
MDAVAVDSVLCSAYMDEPLDLSMLASTSPHAFTSDGPKSRRLAYETGARTPDSCGSAFVFPSGRVATMHTKSVDEAEALIRAVSSDLSEALGRTVRPKRFSVDNVVANMDLHFCVDTQRLAEDYHAGGAEATLKKGVFTWHTHGRLSADHPKLVVGIHPDGRVTLAHGGSTASLATVQSGITCFLQRYARAETGY